MKAFLTLMGFAAVTVAASMAAEAEIDQTAHSFSLNLMPPNFTIGSVSQSNNSGITPEILQQHTNGEWFGTIEKNVADHVKVTNENIGLHIAKNDSTVNGAGSNAGLKFSLPQNVSSATVSFTWLYNNAWGSAITADFSVSVYGFDSDGQSTELGKYTKSWTVDTSAKQSTGTESITLQFPPEQDPFTEYGIILKAQKTVDSDGGGMEIQFSNLTVTGQLAPEPTTGILSLAGVLACCVTRKRNRRRN